MSDEDDLRINTLHRFTKHSPRLVLREYSHCEVPAGCGGVVLRWTDPREGMPVLVLVTCSAPAEVWIDGANVPSRRTFLKSGRHTLGVRVASREDPGGAKDDPPAGNVLVSLAIQPDRPQDERDVLRADRVRFGEGEPPEGWTTTAFSGAALGDARLATSAEREAAPQWLRWRLNRLAEQGRPIFAVPWGAFLRVPFVFDEAEWPELVRR